MIDMKWDVVWMTNTIKYTRFQFMCIEAIIRAGENLNFPDGALEKKKFPLEMINFPCVFLYFRTSKIHISWNGASHLAHFFQTWI